MQTNLLLKPETATDINVQVERLLRDLGNPAPPIKLEQVRALLKLDLRYYSGTNHDWLEEKIHQLRVAGQQVLFSPTRILDVVRKLGLKGLLLPESRRILLDEDLPRIKHRWSEAHEITHDILEWHKGLAHGDAEWMLSPGCHEVVEAEANYGAGRLLFAGERFALELRSAPVDLVRIRTLTKSYGNTITTTLWRSVELSLEPAFGLVTVHPAQSSGVVDNDVRYYVRSMRFHSEFIAVSADQLWDIVRQYARSGKGPLGQTRAILADGRGEHHEFEIESFFNGHDALTFGRHVGRRPVVLGVNGAR